MCSFMREQKSFGVQTARESSQIAARSDDAVARSHDRDRISAIGGADGSGSSRIADRACHLGVGGVSPKGIANNADQTFF